MFAVCIIVTVIVTCLNYEHICNAHCFHILKHIKRLWLIWRCRLTSRINFIRVCFALTPNHKDMIYSITVIFKIGFSGGKSRLCLILLCRSIPISYICTASWCLDSYNRNTCFGIIAVHKWWNHIPTSSVYTVTSVVIYRIVVFTLAKRFWYTE